MQQRTAQAVERDRLERAAPTPAIMAELAALRSALAAAMGATRYQRCVRATACRTAALLIGLPLDSSSTTSLTNAQRVGGCTLRPRRHANCSDHLPPKIREGEAEKCFSIQ